MSNAEENARASKRRWWRENGKQWRESRRDDLVDTRLCLGCGETFQARPQRASTTSYPKYCSETCRTSGIGDSTARRHATRRKLAECSPEAADLGYVTISTAAEMAGVTYKSAWKKFRGDARKISGYLMISERRAKQYAGGHK